MTDQLTEWTKWFSDHRDAIFRDFFQFLSFKSIATDPAFKKETLECADWLVDYLKSIGLEVEKWPTSGQPVIFAKHCKAGRGRPTLLLYNHYDVQPVDPLELWESDPFEPTVRDGEIYARGAQDNKGQCFYTITAVKALFALAETLNFNLKMFIEGEEESGSEGTREVLEAKKEALKSDSLLCIDVGIPSPEQPAIGLGIRGIMTMELNCRGANGDMHSGTLGGVAYNPIRALTTVLSKCWDKEGKVAIPGFYDDVDILSGEEKKAFYMELDEEKVRREFGLRALCPDPGYTIGESASIRPTLEINGINGGYTGEGFKTVLPAVASAKVSCRLVPHQDPKKIFSAFEAHLKAHLPEGMELSVELDSGFAAFKSRIDSPIAKQSAKAYVEVMGKPCLKTLEGGSIPIIVELAKVAGAETVMMGYGLATDQIHAPNEHFGEDRFLKGFLTIGSIFRQLND